MRLAALALTSALGIAVVVGSAQATPLAPALDAPNANIVAPHANIVQVKMAGRCRPGYHPVPGYFSYWRSGSIWVPGHCAPNGFGFYGGGYPY